MPYDSAQRRRRRRVAGLRELFQDILQLIAGLRTQRRREMFDVMRSRATDGRPAKSATREEFLRQLRIVLAEVDKTGVGKLRRLETGAANRGLPPLFGAKPSPDRASFMDSVAGLLGVAGGELLITTLLFMYGADIRTAGTA